MKSPKTVPKSDTDEQTQILPLWNVVLLDDSDHTYDYVIEMLHDIFGYNHSKSYQMAVEVDTKGRVIVFTGPLEHAETKRDQILSYGPDPRLYWSEGSMHAVIEQAE